MELDVVVDLAIVRDGGVCGGFHWLRGRRSEVDDAEATMGEPGVIVPRNPNALAIRPAMREQPVHDLEVGMDGAPIAPFQTNYACDSAHSNLSPNFPEFAVFIFVCDLCDNGSASVVHRR